MVISSHYLAGLKGENYDGSTDIQFPGYWFKALKLGLIAELGYYYNVDPHDKSKNEKRARESLAMAKKQDIPDNTTNVFFAPLLLIRSFKWQVKKQNK